MRPTRFLSQNLRLTLFTRVNCSLCDVVKHTLNQVQTARLFDYSEVDVLKNKEWKQAYQYEVPVLHIRSGYPPVAIPKCSRKQKSCSIALPGRSWRKQWMRSKAPTEPPLPSSMNLRDESKARRRRK
ncbi:hypothetical protein CISG_07391 [Coccidioides immitis RMSCC 3703]|uniref:Glutaredoxin-like protein n=1 Tax=Coccidioides immitis RMSCC 3703 TaxID=454286 RepID=A0A0J8R137_COCIT|nr:hypothetical protein CISG_07391 [Coccidioides immitis RMSCC 3703]